MKYQHLSLNLIILKCFRITLTVIISLPLLTQASETFRYYLPAQDQQPNRISGIRVYGFSIHNDDIQKIYRSYLGLPAKVETIDNLVSDINQQYLNQGYITTQVVYDKNTSSPDFHFVDIRVYEGRLGQIVFEDTQFRLKEDYLKSRIKRASQIPLHAGRLEDQLKLLRADPVIESINASLTASGKIGISNLRVAVKEERRAYGSISIDNHAPPSTGETRLVLSAGYRNATGWGDNLSLIYYHTEQDGMKTLSGSYRLPVNALDGAITLTASNVRTKVVEEPFDALGIIGEKEFWAISYRQPLIRTYPREFAFSLSFSHSDGQTFTFEDVPTPFGFGPDDKGVSRTSVIVFGQDFRLKMAKSALSLSSAFNFGIDALDATINDEPNPDGRFFSWLGQGHFYLRVHRNHLLSLRLRAQLTNDALLASEQFYIGGSNTVRGYRENTRNGDYGFNASFEDQITLERNNAGAASFQIIPFIDVGSAKNTSNNPNPQSPRRVIYSAGLGVFWMPIEHLNLRAVFAYPFVDLDKSGDTLQDNGIHLSASFDF